MYIYSDLERLKKLNKVLSDKFFFEQRGYVLEDIPDYLLELSFPVKNPLPFLDMEGNNILDIGCGSGLDIYLIKKKFPDKNIIGIDISLPLLLEAKKINKELVCSEALELSFKDGIFSTVIMNGVFNLIRDKEKLLIEINRVLCNGGTLFIADIYKKFNFIISSEADLFNIGQCMMLSELYKMFKNYGFKYEFGEYEREIVPGIGIFAIKWRKL